MEENLDALIPRLVEGLIPCGVSTLDIPIYIKKLYMHYPPIAELCPIETVTLSLLF